MQDQNEPPKGINISFGGANPNNNNQGMILNDAPARARMAMDFSLTMARRASPMIAINDVGIQEIQPAKLTNEEVAAWNAACVALTDYFNGKMTTDQFENQMLDGVQVETDRRRPGRVIDCGVCQGRGFVVDANQGKHECGLCEGAGEILVIPHPDSRQEDDEEKVS